MKLGAYKMPAGYGIYTDMNAIRADEELDNLHSLYVDQWDWEQTMNAEDRNVEFLKSTVRKIYKALKTVELKLHGKYPHISPTLPDEIHFFHSEELLSLYPELSPKERETKVAEKFGAVFIIVIGGKLANGKKHDGRAPDYDDWSTPTSKQFRGLNGDIVLWNKLLDSAFEISSMGIRVDKKALLYQLKEENCMERTLLEFHSQLIDNKIPLSIGGGIGQSRLCMYFLKCAHIGEVQSSLWPDEMIESCKANKIYLK